MGVVCSGMPCGRGGTHVLFGLAAFRGSLLAIKYEIDVTGSDECGCEELMHPHAALHFPDGRAMLGA